MELLEHIAISGALIFVGILSWVGIFFMVAMSFQWAKDELKERKRVKDAKNQDAWNVD